jgi:hypothetical protein
MKKLLFTILFLFSVTSIFAQKPIIVKGKIDNCQDPDNSYIRKEWFNPQTLEAETKNYDFSIGEDGTFRVIITEPENYYSIYWIYLGYERTQLNLAPGDSIFMTLNAHLFDESIIYTGHGAGRNNYQRDLFLELWDKNIGEEIDDIHNPAEFLGALNSYSERRMALLDKYMHNGDIDSNYYIVERDLIVNDKANHVLKHNSRFGNHKTAPGNVVSQFDSILKSAVFSDDCSLQHNLMRELVYSMPIYMAERQARPNEPKLKVAIDWAKAHYTETMNLYFDKQLIQNRLNNTTRLTEKNMLIAFFEKQFDNPLLKREMQLQKNRLSVNSFVNSNIFQISVMIIFWLLLVMGLVFLIVWIIQNSTKNGANFNLSLWLKVGFYLIAFILALIFVAESENIGAFFLVIVLLGAFLIHTYFIIPQYAFKNNWRKYVLWLLVELLIFDFLYCFIMSRSISSHPVQVLAEVFLSLVLLSWVSYYIHQMASGKTTLRNLIKNGYLNLELAIHLVLFFLINLVFINNSNSDGLLEQSLIFYPVILLFYFHTFYVYPRFLNKEKLAWFFGINVAILMGVAAVTATYDLLQSQEALNSVGIETKLSELISLKSVRVDVLIVFALILIPSFAYYFIRNRFVKLESTGYKMYRKKEAEFAQLKAQVNPHFLFNTLNTLYAFALKEGSEKTADYIAKLANMMRFMLDDMEKETIPLQREISYIENYIQLQSIRSAVDHIIEVITDIEPDADFSIAPMLLIPFVENAFKHGMNPNNVSHLKINISAQNKNIQFVIENSIDNKFEAYYKERGFGIGIENVKSRLKYIYPNRHTLSIAKTKDKFIVILSIDL